MRLGLVVYGSLNARSGGYLYDRMLVQNLREQGDQVEVISLPWRNYARHLVDNFSPALFQRMQRAGYDLLLQDELNHPSLVWLNRRLRRAAPYPLVSIVHHLRASEPHPGWQRRLYRRLERDYVLSLHGCVYNTHTTRRVVESLVPDPPPGVVSLPGRDHVQPDIDEASIAERARESGPLRILFVGNLIPRKGLHTLIEALHRLPASGWRLTVVGSRRMDRNYVSSIQSLIQRYELGAKIRLLGSLPRTEVAQLMASHHLLAVPSTYEGFGIVYLEAGGFGLPSLATDQGGAREIVEHGRTGYLVPVEDPDSLTRRIRHLLEKREDLIRMGLAARERYWSHPTWEESASVARRFLRGCAAA